MIATTAVVAARASNWIETVATDGEAQATDVVAASDAGFALSGTYQRGVVTSAWVAKVKPGGSLAWQTRLLPVIGGDAMAIAEGPNGTLIAAGSVAGKDVFVAWLDLAGTVIRRMRYGNDGIMERAWGVAATSDGGCVVAGQTFTGATGTDAWILRLLPDGSVLWQTQVSVDGGATLVARSVVETAGGQIAVVGDHVSASGEKQAWLAKLDASGNLLWQHALAVEGDRLSATDLVGLCGDGFAITGAYDESPWIVRVDATGIPQWQTRLDGPDLKEGTAEAIALSPEAGLVIAGTARLRSQAMPTGLAVRLSSEGVLVTQQSTLAAQFSGIAMAADTSVVVAGLSDAPPPAIDTPLVGRLATDLKLACPSDISPGLANIATAAVVHALEVAAVATTRASATVSVPPESFPLPTSSICAGLPEGGPGTLTADWFEADCLYSETQIGDGATILERVSIAPGPVNCGLARIGHDGSLGPSVNYATADDEGFIDPAATPDGGLVMIWEDYFLNLGVLKVDARTLSIVWSVELGVSGGGSGLPRIAAASDGGCVVLTRTRTTTEDFDVVRVAADSTVAWRRRIDGAEWDQAVATAWTAGGDLVVAGWRRSSGVIKPQFVKLDGATGAMAFDRTMSLPVPIADVWTIERQSECRFAFSGELFDESGSNSDAMVGTIDESGSLGWIQRYELPATHEIASILRIAPDGNLVVAGPVTMGSPPPPHDGFVLRLSSVDGGVLSQLRLPAVGVVWYDHSGLVTSNGDFEIWCQQPDGLTQDLLRVRVDPSGSTASCFPTTTLGVTAAPQVHLDYDASLSDAAVPATSFALATTQSPQGPPAMAVCP